MFGLEVLRTCKQICDEGLNVLYGKNVFQFELFRSPRRYQAFQKWLRPIKVAGNDIWSSEAVLEVGRLLQACDSPEWMLLGPMSQFIRSIGEENAARITKIHYRVILSAIVGKSASHDPIYYGSIVDTHNTIFKHSLTGLRELRLVGYWKASYGFLHVSPRLYNTPSSFGKSFSRELCCTVCKVVDTLIVYTPKTNFALV